MVGFLEEKLAVGVYKVFRAYDVSTQKGWYHVYILESTVEYGDGYPFAFVAYVVQTLPVQHLYLFLAVSVVDTFDTVPGVEGVVIGVLHHLVDGIRGNPYALSLCHAVEAGKTVQKQGVVGAHEHRIVPAACANDIPFRRLLPAVAHRFLQGMLYLSEVSGTDWKVCGINGYPLALTALHRAVGEPAPGMVDGVGGTLLVFQRIAPDIVFAPGIFLPEAAACTCRYLTYRCNKHTNDES